MATAVGLGLAIPVLFEVLSRIDSRLLSQVEVRLQTLDKGHDEREILRDLAKAKNKYIQDKNAFLARFVKTAIVNMTISVTCFIGVIISTVFGALEMPQWAVALVVIFSSIPLCSGLLLVIIWDRYVLKLQVRLNNAI